MCSPDIGVNEVKDFEIERESGPMRWCLIAFSTRDVALGAVATATPPGTAPAVMYGLRFRLLHVSRASCYLPCNLLPTVLCTPPSLKHDAR
jgi:hypothetical protein